MNDEAFIGLKSLFASAFPKKCRTCGYVYQTAEQFFEETRDMALNRSSLKAAEEDDGSTIVEVFRNCRCGSTLMDEFACRRDQSEKGKQRREAFARMEKILSDRGYPNDTVRNELLKFMRGEPNLLADWMHKATD
ncbi:MAG: oxidoreductase [Gammaproteobacteria bacterium]